MSTKPESGHNSATVGSQSTKKKDPATRAGDRQTSVRPPKAPPLPRRLYDLKAISAYLGIPVYTVREIIWRGDLPCVRIGRRQYIDIRDLDSYIDANKQTEGA